jgi:hypothetical protein
MTALAVQVFRYLRRPVHPGQLLTIFVQIDEAWIRKTLIYARITLAFVSCALVCLSTDERRLALYDPHISLRH